MVNPTVPIADKAQIAGTAEDMDESSKEILMELLGYTSDDCETLEKEGTVLFQ